MTKNAQLTDVSGFFNPNDYPIQVNISALQTQLRLGPKQFVMDREKNKINDPILAAYVGPNKLAAEKSNKPVPLRLIRKPEQRTDDGRFSFAGKHDVGVDEKGNIPDMPQKPTHPATEANNMSVKGYTVEQAIKKGLIRQPRAEGDRLIGLPEIKDEAVAPASAAVVESLPASEEVIDVGDNYTPPQSTADIAKQYVDLAPEQVLPAPGKQDKVSPPGSPVGPTESDRAAQTDAVAEHQAKTARRRRGSKAAVKPPEPKLPEPKV